MKTNRTVGKEINGAFALLFTVKAAILALSYLMSYLLLKITGSYGLYRRVTADLSGYGSWEGILYNISVYLLGAAVPLLFCLALRGKRVPDSEDGIFLAKPGLSQVGAALGPTVLITGAASYLGNILLSLFYQIYGYDGAYGESDGLTLNLWLLLGFLISVSVLPALTEEFIMRGEVLRRMRHFGRGSMIFLSGLLFMLMHNTLEQLPMAFAAGCCFAYYTLKFRSVWPAVLCHFVINLNSCILSVLFEAVGGGELVFWYYVFCGLYLLSMVGLTVFGGVMFGFGLPRDSRTREDKASAALIFRSPFFWLYMILAFGLIVYDITGIIGF